MPLIAHLNVYLMYVKEKKPSIKLLKYFEYEGGWSNSSYSLIFVYSETYKTSAV